MRNPVLAFLEDHDTTLINKFVAQLKKSNKDLNVQIVDSQEDANALRNDAKNLNSGVFFLGPRLRRGFSVKLSKTPVGAVYLNAKGNKAS